MFTGASFRCDRLLTDVSVVRQLRFLVVDDTAEIRDLMVRMVERAGHVAEEAADGVEATESLSAHRYDVMLLDLSMPRMDGEDVVRWLHAHPDRAEGLRTVVVTAWAGDRRGRLQELGVTTVLPKPFRRQHLTDLIAGVAIDTEN
ncbi:response regulator [Nocardioides glacieisoli]|jgi:CheY-like chemotaxis protein|uniref:Response regulator n=1 Tax=Nocardioides glacieisoli TaxID=1168730 RepID=A0A4Q2RND1_9ACTN|nr:response regulator [Nocardioides glacieisoli]RYB90068.1 response regulator [Nocardioides glacieisoli]